MVWYAVSIHMVWYDGYVQYICMYGWELWLGQIDLSDSCMGEEELAERGQLGGIWYTIVV